MDWRQPRLRVTGGVKGGGNYGRSQRDRKKRGLVVTGKAFPVAVECVPCPWQMMAGGEGA